MKYLILYCVLSILLFSLINCSAPRGADDKICFSKIGIYLIDSKDDKFTMLYFSESIISHSKTDNSIQQAAKCKEPINIKYISSSGEEIVQLSPNIATVKLSKDSTKVVRFGLFHLSSLEDKNSSHRFFIDDENIPILETKSLTHEDLLLIPDVSQNKDFIDFSLYSIRLNYRTRERSFFPSSEELRIELSNLKGAKIWQSNENMHFLAVIGEVKPTNIGEIYKYNMIMNLRDFNKSNLQHGLYNIQYILPIVPKPNFLNFNLFLD